MMASLDAEAEMENLFAADEAEEDAATQSLTQEEAERTGGANLDLTTAAGDGKTKKRVIRNPQPKLNPERLMGPRGIQTIEDIFQNWESKGKGKEFEDLDIIMGKLEHWAHRLYPKLPFDNVIDVVANRLGSKKTVQTHMKKIRLGMVTAPVHVGGGDAVLSDNDDDVARYGADEEPDVFQEMLNKAGGGTADAPPMVSQPTAPAPSSGGLTEEQKERIRRNKELAAAKKREKLEREQREAEEEARRKEMDQQFEDEEEMEREMMSANEETVKKIEESKEKEDSIDQIYKDEDIGETSPVTATTSTNNIDNNRETETLDLDEMMEQMEED